MVESLKLFGAGAILTILLDFIWLGLLMPAFYRRELASLARLGSDGKMDPIWWAAGVVYVLIPVGIVAFVLRGAEAETALQLGLRGFLFGIVLYGVYEFTNHATLRDWPASLLVIDTRGGRALAAEIVRRER